MLNTRNVCIYVKYTFPLPANLAFSSYFSTKIPVASITEIGKRVV